MVLGQDGPCPWMNVIKPTIYSKNTLAGLSLKKIGTNNTQTLHFIYVHPNLVDDKNIQ